MLRITTKTVIQHASETRRQHNGEGNIMRRLEEHWKRRTADQVAGEPQDQKMQAVQSPLHRGLEASRTCVGATIRTAKTGPVDREWFIAAAYRLRAASADLWRRVQRFYAELLRSEGLIAPEEEDRDREYFRQRMAEARERRRRERMRRVAERQANRSGVLSLVEPVQLDAIPGLTEVLDSLVGVPIPAELVQGLIRRSDFDLSRYEDHILGHLGGIATTFEAISPLIEDARKDRIYRFIAMIFLAHARRIEIQQCDGHVWLKHRETHEQGQGIPEPAAEAA